MQDRGSGGSAGSAFLAQQYCSTTILKGSLVVLLSRPILSSLFCLFMSWGKKGYGYYYWLGGLGIPILEESAL